MMISSLQDTNHCYLNDPDTCIIQVLVPRQDQRLAGFLIESLEGIAIHSRGKDENHLRLIYNRSTEQELQSFLAAWHSGQTQSFRAAQGGELLLRASNSNGESHHV